MVIVWVINFVRVGARWKNVCVEFRNEVFLPRKFPIGIVLLRTTASLHYTPVHQRPRIIYSGYIHPRGSPFRIAFFPPLHDASTSLFPLHTPLLNIHTSEISRCTPILGVVSTQCLNDTQDDAGEFAAFQVSRFRIASGVVDGGSCKSSLGQFVFLLLHKYVIDRTRTLLGFMGFTCRIILVYSPGSILKI